MLVGLLLPVAWSCPPQSVCATALSSSLLWHRGTPWECWPTAGGWAGMPGLLLRVCGQGQRWSLRPQEEGILGFREGLQRAPPQAQHPRSQPGPPCRRAGEHLHPALPQRSVLTHPHDAFLSPRPPCRVSPGSRESSPRGAGMLSSILCGGGRVNVDEPVGGGDEFSLTGSDITKRGRYCNSSFCKHRASSRNRVC